MGWAKILSLAAAQTTSPPEIEIMDSVYLHKNIGVAKPVYEIWAT